jgi:hypothetical protein
MTLDNLEVQDLKCQVLHCMNHASEGRFVGLLCTPCNTYISTEVQNNSQAFRNVNEKLQDQKDKCLAVVLQEMENTDPYDRFAGVNDVVKYLTYKKIYNSINKE